MTIEQTTPIVPTRERPRAPLSTPGIASASETSMDQILACGCGLLKVAPQSIPSLQRSEEYSNSPLTFGMPSARVVCSPTLPGIWTGARGRSRVGTIGAVCSMVIEGPPVCKASGFRGFC